MSLETIRAVVSMWGMVEKRKREGAQKTREKSSLGGNTD